jgi:hypothetical protein
MPSTMSQTAAIKLIRDETGLSEGTVTALVKAMPKKQDGAREKVYTVLVNRLIKEEAAPKASTNTTGIKPMSAKKRQRIQERCL